MKIHSSALSVIEFDASGQVLTMVWNKDSGIVDEHTVKSEIGGVIDYIKKYHARNVIVDSRNYQYRDNPNIQSWIVRDYMPRVVDSAVIKYAIVVDTQVIGKLKGNDDAEDGILPIVDYFTELADAQHWINS